MVHIDSVLPLRYRKCDCSLQAAVYLWADKKTGSKDWQLLITIQYLFVYCSLAGMFAEKTTYSSWKFASASLEASVASPQSQPPFLPNTISENNSFPSWFLDLTTQILIIRVTQKEVVLF